MTAKGEGFATRIDEINAEYAKLRETPGRLLLSKLRADDRLIEELKPLTDKQVIAYCYRRYHGTSDVAGEWLDEANALYLRNGDLPDEVLHWLLPKEFRHR